MVYDPLHYAREEATINCSLVALENEISKAYQYYLLVFNKTIIPLALVGYEMIIANSALRPSLAIYHLISNKREWNNCLLSPAPSWLDSSVDRILHRYCGVHGFESRSSLNVLEAFLAQLHN